MDRLFLDFGDKLYKKSLEIIKSVQLNNGGCLASPPGKRYPYIYPRDHSIILLGFLSAGEYRRVKKGIKFIFSTQLKDGAFPQRVDKNGRDASYKPIQIDNVGLTIYCLSKYSEISKDYELFKELKNEINDACKYIIKNIDKNRRLVFSNNSIHEFPPLERGFEIWANSVCCAALMRVGKIKRMLKMKTNNEERWGEQIRDSVLKFMWNKRKNTFLKTIRIAESSSIVVEPDASKYAPAYFGIIKDNNKKIIKVVEEIEKELWHKRLGGICRYPKYEGRNNGGWGPWPHFTLMIARNFINRKIKNKAKKYISWIHKVAYKFLLPEHIAEVKEFEEYVKDFKNAGILRKDRMIIIKNARKHPMFKKGIAYITVPLAWPHAEYIITWNRYKEEFLR